MSDKTEKSEYIAIGPKLEDGSNLVIKKSEDELSIGVVRQLENGKPINGDVIELAESKGTPWQRVTYIIRGKPSTAANPAYRDNYDKIWNKNTEIGHDNRN